MLIFARLWRIIEHLSSLKIEKKMPRKHLIGDQIPSLVDERLKTWGACIRGLRMTQRMRALDLCARMSITHTTLRRLERGDPGAGAGLYLTALMILGALDLAAPPLPSHLVDLPDPQGRVRLPRAPGADDDF